MNALEQPVATSALVAALVACSALAQGPETYSTGPLVAVPHGLSTDPATSSTPFDETRLQVKRIGYKDESFPDGKPGEFPPPPPLGMPPDYASLTLFGLPPAIRPDIDAFSVGLDWINSNGDGVEILPPGHWGGITFSVDRDAAGLPGSVIEREALDVPQGAGGDLFFYVFPDSVLPPPLVDETFLVQDASEMDIDEAGLRPEMDAHDLYVSLVYADNPSIAAALPPPIDVPRAFFSVSDATKALIPTPWLAGVAEARSGATIFFTEWDGFAWTPIAPYLLPSEMSLLETEEVDAIAVDLIRCELLFSTKTPARDQLLWMDLCPPAAIGGGGGAFAAPKPYRRPDGSPIVVKAKIAGTDDLDGVCALDPGGDFYERLLGSPVQLFPSSSAPQTWASVYVQENVLANQRTYRTTFTGWPPAGRQAGATICLLQLPGFTPPFDFYANPSRDLANIFLGGPEEAELPVMNGSGLEGFEIDFQWAAVDLATFDLEVPYGVRIVL